MNCLTTPFLDVCIGVARHKTNIIIRPFLVEGGAGNIYISLKPMWREGETWPGTYNYYTIHITWWNGSLSILIGKGL